MIRLGSALRFGLLTRKDPGSSGDISQFQALTTALAAAVGTGNIVGVATARRTAASFAIFAVIACFGIGNMTQGNSIAQNLESSFSVPTWVTGIVLTAFAQIFTGAFTGTSAVGGFAGSAIIIAVQSGVVPGAGIYDADLHRHDYRRELHRPRHHLHRDLEQDRL